LKSNLFGKTVITQDVLSIYETFLTFVGLIPLLQDGTVQAACYWATCDDFSSEGYRQ
jgi:hypothetical protein